MKKFGWIFIGLFALDQVTKFWAMGAAFGTFFPTEIMFKDGVFIRELSSFLNLIVVRNTGVSFSLFSFMPSQLPLIILTSVIAIWLFKWFKREKDKLLKTAIIFVLAGAMGNLVDRIWLGGVIDFIDAHYASYHWPTFNIADTWITCGAGLYLLSFVLKRKI